MESNSALSKAAFNQLEGVRGIKKAQIEKFFAEREGDTKVLAETATTLMTEAFFKLDAIKEAKAQSINRYFNEQLSGSIHALKDTPLTSDAVSEYETAFRMGGGKVGGAEWNTVNDKYHSWLTENLEENGFYDIFLISLDGDVVYSVTAEADLGENVINGSLKN